MTNGNSTILTVALLALVVTATQMCAQSTNPPHAFSSFTSMPAGAGNVDGTGSAARFYNPEGVAVETNGNVYVADTQNHTIRKITPAGVVTTLAGSPGQPGSADGTNSAARFHNPTSVAVDNAGNVFVADTSNNTIRKVTPAGSVTTLAGNAGKPGSADGTGGAARFYNPTGVAVETNGNVLVADNYTVRKITLAGVVTTLATLAGSTAQPGVADGTNSARLDSPCGVAVDGTSTIYVLDYGNFTIRKFTPAGALTTLAGSAGQYGTNDGTGNAARFFLPRGVAADGAGNVHLADTQNHTIRKITPAGVVTTLAGSSGPSG